MQLTETYKYKATHLKQWHTTQADDDCQQVCHRHYALGKTIIRRIQQFNTWATKPETANTTYCPWQMPKKPVHETCTRNSHVCHAFLHIFFFHKFLAL